MDVEPPQQLRARLKIPLKTMTGPGPSNIHSRVRDALTLPAIGISFLHPECAKLMSEIVAGIKYAFQTNNRVTLCISATVHGGIEAICCNLLEPGDRIVSCINGLWGERFAIIAERNDAVVKRLIKPFGNVFGFAEIEQVLKEVKPKLLFITYGESCGGTLQPLTGLGDLCHRHGCLLVVDGVAAVGGAPMYMDRWGIDVLYIGSQKVLGSPPGLTPISLSNLAWQTVTNRRHKIRSYLFDLTELVYVFGIDGLTPRYHHTPSMTNLYALREALAIIADEGLENCWLRHKQCTEQLHKGIKQLGLELHVKDPAVRLPVVTTITIPPDVDWMKVSSYAMDKYKVEIAGGLADGFGKIWRIGIMGYNANPKTVSLVLQALGDGLQYARGELIQAKL